MSPRIAFRLVSGIVAGALCGCYRDEVRSYTVPTEPSSNADQQEMSVQQEAEASLAWTTPSGWQQSASDGLRLASFTAQGIPKAMLDVSIVSFPGTGGDDLANVNRWRGQLGQPPIGVDSLGGLVRKIGTPAGEFSEVEVKAMGEAKEMVGGWLRSGSHVWFLKMVGAADAVEAQKGAFSALVGSLSFGGRSSVPMQAAVGPQGLDLAELAWTKPDSWTEAPPGAMGKASYVAKEGAKVTVTAFPGDVGGMLANVNRWRSQLGLGEIAEADLATAVHETTVGGMSFAVVDQTSAGADSHRILVAITAQGGQTWFFKLVGPTKATSASEAEFNSLLASVRVVARPAQ